MMPQADIWWCARTEKLFASIFTIETMLKIIFTTAPISNEQVEADMITDICTEMQTEAYI
jgi:hypothetical protein